MYHLDLIETEARKRLVAATTALADRAGLPAPAPETSREPLPTPKANSDLLMMTGLAEAVVRLASDVDEVRTQLAAARNGGKTR